ncbi:MAG: hypothetical protein HYU56_01640 [Candidatus Aenigmarchaeota archaeon]|nr:hypothetical protein [Candidatus Aenigmarchaeota archaeon]
MVLKICLLGSIPKGDEIRKFWKDWKINYKNSLSKIDGIEFVDGDAWKEEEKSFLVFGHDSYLIKSSDIIIVNAEAKLGAGTSQEMIIAKYFSKPVITVLPKDTHHRKSNVVFNSTNVPDWIHPFISAMSDIVVESVDEACQWVQEYKENPKSKTIKNISVIDQAINSYLDYIR